MGIRDGQAKVSDGYALQAGTEREKPRRTVFPKRASRVCQRATLCVCEREKESISMCVCGSV